MSHTDPWPGATAALARSPEAEQTWARGPVRLGYIDYLNCLPVYYGIEQGILDLPVAIKKGTPAVCNRMFREGAMDIAPISSIEAARQCEHSLVLPNLSISADGKVGSIFLFTRGPLTDLTSVALPNSSATAVVLCKIILSQGYGCRPQYFTMAPDLEAMLKLADAALIIGDDAMLANAAVEAGQFPGVRTVDLGIEWKQLTGQVMVYGLWTVRRDFAERNPEGVRLAVQLLQNSQAFAWSQRDNLIAEALRRRPFPRPVIEEYFTLIRHEFDERFRRGLYTFLKYAADLGEVSPDLRLAVWGEEQ